MVFCMVSSVFLPKLPRTLSPKELLFKELKGSFSLLLSAFPPRSKDPWRWGCIVVHSMHHQSSVYWWNRQLSWEMATASCGDSVLGKNEKCLCPCLGGFCTDDIGEPTNTDKAVCTVWLLDRDLLLCKWHHWVNAGNETSSSSKANAKRPKC